MRNNPNYINNPEAELNRIYATTGSKLQIRSYYTGLKELPVIGINDQMLDHHLPTIQNLSFSERFMKEIDAKWSSRISFGSPYFYNADDILKTFMSNPSASELKSRDYCATVQARKDRLPNNILGRATSVLLEQGMNLTRYFNTPQTWEDNFLHPLDILKESQQPIVFYANELNTLPHDKTFHLSPSEISQIYRGIEKVSDFILSQNPNATICYFGDRCHATCDDQMRKYAQKYQGVFIDAKEAERFARTKQEFPKQLVTQACIALTEAKNYPFTKENNSRALSQMIEEETDPIKKRILVQSKKIK